MGRAGSSSGSGGSRSSGGSGGSHSRSSSGGSSSSSSSGNLFSGNSTIDYSDVEIDIDWVKSIQFKLIIVIFLAACIIPGLFIFIDVMLVPTAFMMAIVIWVISFILLIKSYMKSKKNNNSKEDK